MTAVNKSIVHFLGWTLNNLVSPGGDGNLLHELHFFKAELRDSQNNTLLLPFVLICTILIGLVSCLPCPALLH
jgi:hypothetical protein